MRTILILAIAGVAVGVLAATPPAHAKTCKDMVTAKARSAAQVSDDSRLRRARAKAMSNWSARARDTYGWAYRFWRRSSERKVECSGGASATYCTATAKPCRLL